MRARLLRLHGTGLESSHPFPPNLSARVANRPPRFVPWILDFLGENWFNMPPRTENLAGCGAKVTDCVAVADSLTPEPSEGESFGRRAASRGFAHLLGSRGREMGIMQLRHPCIGVSEIFRNDGKRYARHDAEGTIGVAQSMERDWWADACSRASLRQGATFMRFLPVFRFLVKNELRP